MKTALRRLFPARSRSAPKTQQAQQVDDFYHDPTLAGELLDLAHQTEERRVASTRDTARALVMGIVRITHECLTNHTYYQVARSERIEAIAQLAKSLTQMDWRPFGFDDVATKAVLDAETATILVNRIANGESLHFLEELLYERYRAYERYGALDGATVPALRLANTRRRRPSHTLQSRRRVRDVPGDTLRVE